MLIDELACILGCKVAHLPLKYLGLLLSVSFKLKSISDGILKRLEKLKRMGKMLGKMEEDLPNKGSKAYPYQGYAF